MENQDGLLARVLRGDSAERHHWDEYYRTFHAMRPRTTSTYAGRLRTEDAKSSYDVLADALAPVRSVLDIGCGDGVLLAAIHERFPSAVLSGVDLGEVDLEFARERLHNVPIGTLAVENALDLPFGDESFDAVVSHMVFMLIPELDDVLRQARRVLKEDGTVAFVVGDPAATEGHMRRFFTSVNEAIRTEHPKFTPLNPADPRIFDTNGIREAMEGQGFTNVAQVRFKCAAQLDADSVYEQLLLRYYTGSLGELDLQRIKDVAGAFASPSFRYTESLRLVTANR